MTTFQNVWPINENNEIITDIGTGTRTIVGQVAQDLIPVTSNGGVALAPPLYAQWGTISKSGASSTITGTTAETAAATILIPGGLLKENSILKITACMRVQTAADAGNKSYTMRFGGLGGFAGSQQFFAAGVTTTDTTLFTGHIFCRNSKTAQLGGLRNSYAGIGHASASDLVAMTYDTNSNTYIYICCDPGNVGDVMVLESYIVEVVL